MNFKKVLIIVFSFCLLSCDAILGTKIPVLSIEMTEKQIDKYYDFLLNKIDKEPVKYVEYKKPYTVSDKEKINEEVYNRTNSTKYYDYGIIFYGDYNNKNSWAPTLVSEDGYVSYNSYKLSKEITDLKKDKINPLLLNDGYLVTTKDIEVYSDDTLSTKIGLLPINTVIKTIFNNSSNRDLTPIICFAIEFEYNKIFIPISEFPEVKNLVENVRYQIIDNHFNKIIGDKKIIYNNDIITTNDGSLCINITDEKAECYFWEYFSNYYFDKDGKFLRYDYERYFGL